jgi:hypothetical protein
MIKMIIFVHCNGWKNGGYENTLYFESIEQANNWLSKKPHCEKISIEQVTDEEFAEDFIGLL